MFDSAKAPMLLNALNASSVFALSREAEASILPNFGESFWTAFYSFQWRCEGRGQSQADARACIISGSCNV